MVSSSNIKDYKESMRVLSNLNERSTKLKSNFKVKRSSSKETKQAVNTTTKNKVINSSKSNKHKNTKLINKKLIKEVVKKAIVMNKSTIQRPRKKTICGSEKVNVAKSINHVANNEDLKLHAENIIKKSDDKMLKHGLKRKHSINDGMQNNKNVTVNQQLPKLRKRRKLNDTEKSTNTLNLNDLSREHILQCISAIFHLTEEQLKNKNALFEGEHHPILMQVTCIRVPKTPRRQMRM